MDESAVAAGGEGDVVKFFAVDEDSGVVFGFFARFGEEVLVVIFGDGDFNFVDIRVVEDFVNVFCSGVEIGASVRTVSESEVKNAAKKNGDEKIFNDVVAEKAE